MVDAVESIIYWDSSAILSALFRDTNTRKALTVARRRGTHLISTLACAEVIAVVRRLENDRDVSAADAAAARAALRGAHWRPLLLQPDRQLVDEVAKGASLRGADLWHLATASTLAREVPELRVITFDRRLHAAAVAAGIALGQRAS